MILAGLVGRMGETIGNLNGRDHVEDVTVTVKIILK
jgi:hypothetical protein